MNIEKELEKEIVNLREKDYNCEDCCRNCRYSYLVGTGSSDDYVCGHHDVSKHVKSKVSEWGSSLCDYHEK